MNDVEDRVRAALVARAAVTEPSYDAADELAERISVSKKRRRRRFVTIAAGVLVLVAVALPVTLKQAGTDTGAPPAAPVSRQPPAIAGHLFFAGMLSADETAVFDAQTGHRTGANLTVVPSAEAVAGWPGHGFLVAQRTADGCHTRLEPILTETNSASTLLLAPRPGLLDEIMVSPDGRRLAAVERSCGSPGSVDVLVIDLATGAQGRWRPPAGVNAVDGLTWSADSRRLAYTSGLNTGGGLGGGYTELDAANPGGSLSAVLHGTGQVEIGNRRCEVDRGLWLGTTGQFAVFAYCPGDDDLYLAEVPFGVPEPRGQVIASLPGERATTFPDASVTDDGRHLLLTTDRATYRIDDGKIFRLDGHWRSPSW